jgi:hypothetical protein
MHVAEQTAVHDDDDPLAGFLREKSAMTFLTTM